MVGKKRTSGFLLSLLLCRVCAWLPTYEHILNLDTVSLSSSPPSPPFWSSNFHARMSQERNGSLAITDLYYDFPRGRNINLIQGQHKAALWDNERGNGSTYYYTPEKKQCKCIQMPAGLLRPDWLQGAVYNGTESIDNFDCHVWSQGDAIPPHTGYFVTYYEDVQTRFPVRWVFYDNAKFDIISWKENETLQENLWQIPDYCLSVPCKSATGYQSFHNVELDDWDVYHGSSVLRYMHMLENIHATAVSLQ